MCGLYDRRVLENTSLNLSNEVVLVIAQTLCQFGICDGIPLLSPRFVEDTLCCIVISENLTSTCYDIILFLLVRCL